MNKPKEQPFLKKKVGEKKELIEILQFKLYIWLIIISIITLIGVVLW